MQVTAGSGSRGELHHPTGDARVNEVKVCSHGKLKSEITDANTRGNEGSAPSMSISQCLNQRGKAGAYSRSWTLYTQSLFKLVLPLMCFNPRKAVFVLKCRNKKITSNVWD